MLSPFRYIAHTGRRHLSTSRTLCQDPTHSIYISLATDPYFNLSFEDWLFRHKPPNEPLLLLYRDSPCVVIGRNQNPWKEVNLPALHRTNIPFIRRRSGGGTVYHDMGNTNYSIHLPRSSFDRQATAQVVLRAVRSLGLDANVNPRNDICVGTDKMILPYAYRHVSGSAYKIVNNRAYHHGTMLISTRLDLLGDLLRSNKETMETKGVASVRSPVCNLQQFNTAVTHDKFVDAVVHSFREEYGVNEEIQFIQDSNEVKSIDYIRAGMAELPSWDWAYGQTPEFTYNIQHTFSWGALSVLLRSKHGKILSCIFNGDVPASLVNGLNSLARRLEGQKYGFADDNLGSDIEWDENVAQIWHWLRTEINQ